MCARKHTNNVKLKEGKFCGVQSVSKWCNKKSKSRSIEKLTKHKSFITKSDTHWKIQGIGFNNIDNCEIKCLCWV